MLRENLGLRSLIVVLHSMTETDDIIREFVVESSEGLDQLDRDLVALEQKPNDPDLIARIFRCIHTVKGTGSFLGYSKLEAVSHAGESLLSLLRDGARILTPQRVGGLVQLVDAIRAILDRIETTGEEGDGDYAALYEVLSQLQNADTPALVATRPPDLKNMGQLLIDRGAVDLADVEKAAKQQAHGDPRRIGEILVDQASVRPGAIVDALEIQQAARAQAGGRSGAGDSSVRIDVRFLDRLMSLVGELALVRNQIVQHAAASPDVALSTTSQQLHQITIELQEGVIKSRMEPIGAVWAKFPRVARDLAAMLTKQVRVEMEGEDTELDRTIIEAIKDPLTHIIRNSVDHGIETPAVRLADGKPAEGRVLMRAYHEGRCVVIEIVDDGAGIDPERIKAKAVQAGVISAEQAGRMSRRDALDLIFVPGLSTAAKVTTLSGRGVGMDVVRANIERIGGAVDVSSAKGKGAKLRITIPLGLPVVPGPIGSTVSPRYGIPQAGVPELGRREGDAMLRKSS